MHPVTLLVFVGAVLVAGALGYAFRGAIGREIKIAEKDAETLAQRLESGVASEARAVAGEIRAKLAKL